MSRVDVFGVGAVSAAGNSLSTTWEAVNRGETPYPPNVTDEHKGFFAEGHETLVDMAAVAIDDALGPEWTPEAIFVGSSSDSVLERESELGTAPPRVAHRLAERLSIPYEDSYQFASACASSSIAIGAAVDMIDVGAYEQVLAGGVDEITRSSIAGFHACRIYGEECNPFAAGRRGLVLGEGAAFLLLSAPNPFVKSFAQLYGTTVVSGARDMVGMSPEGIVRAMRGALKEAGLERVDLVITHGTGTVVNDEAESEAIREVWPVETPLIASYKRWIGHPQGASGAMGVALAIAALQQQRVFPTLQGAIDPTLFVARHVTIASYPKMLESVMVLSHGTWDIYSALVVTS